MRKRWFGAGLLLTVLVGCAGTQPVQKPQPLNTDEEKTLYALGLVLGKNISVFSLSPTELDLVKRGLSDAITGNKPEVELETFGPKIDELAKTRGKVRAEKEKGGAQAFLDKASKEPGAVKTDSGMIFFSITEGTGALPTATDTVKVHYRGTLTDGTEFDSSYKRNEPASFPLNQVVPCWTEGLQKVKVGGKARLVCPAAIAYGDEGRPPVIPGGATLNFEVELIEIQAPAPIEAPK